MIVWVQLPELKIHFYHKEVLTTLGNLIGRTIKLNYHTLTQQRAKFARLAMEVDVSRPLVPRIWLDDDWQPVEYENLSVVCFECGKIGHSTATCPKLWPVSVHKGVDIAVGSIQTPSSEVSPEANAGFGPWMLVSRKGRRNPRESPNKGKEKDLGTSNKGKEKDSGSHQLGSMNKNGKNTLKISEPEVSLPMVALQNPPQPQRSSGQVRKENGIKHNGEGRRNGKEQIRDEDSSAGKGLLGPGPPQGPISKEGQKPKADSSVPSTSNVQVSLATTLNSGPNCGTSSGSGAPVSPPSLAFTPSTLVTTGSNGTVMQVVQVSSSQSEGLQRQPEQSSPSTANRTKGKKKGKGRTEKRSPAKLNPIRPLQIWSPIKDKRTKSKARMASLTLHKINAWTEAAHSVTKSSFVKGSSDAPHSVPSQEASLGDPPLPAV
ncbi:unnamed protein product [Linum tenue]|uniref:CCHC-type domain-containing protein n=1 Tax=Linum tenue TaxID=586396 RepID=A0AAV0HVW1_9ROSI|nr:unnamed protein product [Linum tenue]